MTSRAAVPQDRDGWMPHAVLAAFAGLVATILRLVFGWSAPLQAWIGLSGVATAVLAAHAAWRAAQCATRRRWRLAAGALLFAAALATMASVMLRAGHAHRRARGVLIDAPLVDAAPHGEPS